MKKIIFKKSILAATLTIAMTGFANLAFAKANETKSQTLASLDPDSAFKELKAGNQRFLKGDVRKDGQAVADISRLSKGQSPNSIVLSCSDSRVPPEAVFDQKLGEMFTVRSAGSDNLVKLVSDIHPRIKSKFDEKHPSKDLKTES
ncbi:MAG: hypothetical protein H7256_09585 [Bdellovibrio sp.]|nr:hypothetical protein [Bdellovibrio sp.]